MLRLQKVATVAVVYHTLGQLLQAAGAALFTVHLQVTEVQVVAVAVALAVFIQLEVKAVRAVAQILAAVAVVQQHLVVAATQMQVQAVQAWL
jgi:hypothetical protein